MTVERLNVGLDSFEVFMEPPKPSPWREADEDDRRRAARVPHGYARGRRIEADTEEAFGADEEYHPALQKVKCPSCGRTCAPLLSSRTRLLGSGWMWRGISHQEPYCEWLCVCPGCGIDYVLTTVTPQ